MMFTPIIAMTWALIAAVQVNIPILELDAFVGLKKRTNHLGFINEVVTAERRRTSERKED